MKIHIHYFDTLKQQENKLIPDKREGQRRILLVIQLRLTLNDRHTLAGQRAMHEAVKGHAKMNICV